MVSVCAKIMGCLAGIGRENWNHIPGYDITELTLLHQLWCISQMLLMQVSPNSVHCWEHQSMARNHCDSFTIFNISLIIIEIRPPPMLIWYRSSVILTHNALMTKKKNRTATQNYVSSDAAIQREHNISWYTTYGPSHYEKVILGRRGQTEFVVQAI